jgi:hypothetical protein
MVGREKAVETHAGEVRRQVIPDRHHRQLLSLSTGTLLPTNMDPRPGATRRELGHMIFEI